jgi:hypothetical protein
VYLQTDDQNAGNWCPKPLNTGNPSIIFSDRGGLWKINVILDRIRRKGLGNKQAGKRVNSVKVIILVCLLGVRVWARPTADLEFFS